MPPSRVNIVEVGPRDGLQNEARRLPVAVRVKLIRLLADAGLSVIEAGSFTSAKWIPQMQDSGEVLRAVMQNADAENRIRYPVLVPNLRGLEDAMRAGVEEVAVFTAASEAFSRANTNCGIDESFTRIEAVMQLANERGIKVRGYVSCVLGCPYQGEVAAAEVARVARRLLALGCYEISLGDTIGVGTPSKARAMIECVAADVPMQNLAVHFHDTYGQAVANIYAALQLGIATVDSAIAGLGGCPYSPGASGNVATEDVVYLLDGLGIDSGVSLQKLLPAGDYICAQLGRRNASKVANALTSEAAKSQPAADESDDD